MSEEKIVEPLYYNGYISLDERSMLRDYIKEIQQENTNLKQALNEIREYINKNTDCNPIDNVIYKPFIYKKEEYEFIEDILQIIDKYKGSDK